MPSKPKPPKPPNEGSSLLSSSSPSTSSPRADTPSSSSSSTGSSLGHANPTFGPDQTGYANPRPAIEGESFTLRGVLVGLAVGLVICFSNMYFGLQTGWVSTMTMPASLLGFGIFRVLGSRLELPFSPVENVLVQTVAGSMAIMPLGW